ncbi:TPA: hypothetical protein ACOL2D_002359 [Vibrio parahaemolyticus]
MNELSRRATEILSVFENIDERIFLAQSIADCDEIIVDSVFEILAVCFVNAERSLKLTPPSLSRDELSKALEITLKSLASSKACSKYYDESISRQTLELSEMARENFIASAPPEWIPIAGR